MFTDFQPNGQAPVSSTSKKLNPLPHANTEESPKFSPPRRLSTDEIPQVVNEYRLAARNVMEAGKFLPLSKLQKTTVNNFNSLKLLCEKRELNDQCC